MAALRSCVQVTEAEHDRERLLGVSPSHQAIVFTSGESSMAVGFDGEVFAQMVDREAAGDGGGDDLAE